MQTCAYIYVDICVRTCMQTCVYINLDMYVLHRCIHNCRHAYTYMSFMHIYVDMCSLKGVMFSM